MGIIDFYTGLLNAAGLIVDEKGGVRYLDKDVPLPLTISGQHLVLPTKDILSAGVSEEQIAFHPVCEGIARRESTVLKRYRKALTYRINYVMAELLAQLMDIAVDSSQHSRLSPDQAQFLAMLTKADKTTIEKLGKILSKVDTEDVNRRLVSLYIKRAAIVNGKEYPRAAIVTFPLLDHIATTDKTIYGVTVRPREKDLITALFKFILPDADVLGEYSYGTNDLTAPNLHCLTLAAANIFEKFNLIVGLYREHLEDDELLQTDLSFLDGLENVAKYRALVPELRGNAGEKLDGAVEEDEVKPSAAPAVKSERTRPMIGYPAPDKERPTAPVAQPAPAPVQTGYQQAPRPQAAQPHQFPEARPATQPSAGEENRKNKWMDAMRPQMQPMQPAYFQQQPQFVPPAPQMQQPMYMHNGHQASYMQPMHQPMQQPMQQPMHQPAYPPMHQPMQQPMHQPMYQQPMYQASHGTGTPGRNAVAYEQQRRMMEQQAYYQQQPNYPYGGPNNGSTYYRY